jgi:hypothetical protein
MLPVACLILIHVFFWGGAESKMTMLPMINKNRPEVHLCDMDQGLWGLAKSLRGEQFLGKMDLRVNQIRTVQKDSRPLWDTYVHLNSKCQIMIATIYLILADQYSFLRWLHSREQPLSASWCVFEPLPVTGYVGVQLDLDSHPNIPHPVLKKTFYAQLRVLSFN